jgi:prevent-host-death family protein
MGMATSYSIYEAKARLSEIIRAVKGRKRVVITERGVPVARVVPFEASSLEARAAELAACGAVVHPKPNQGGFRLIRPLKGALQRFLAERD